MNFISLRRSPREAQGRALSLENGDIFLYCPIIQCYDVEG